MPDTTKATGGQSNTITAPGMNDILGASKWLFNSGQSWAPYTASQVTPFSTQTMNALKGMTANATGAAPGFQALYNNTLNAAKNPLDPLQNQQVTNLQGIVANPYNAQQQGALNYFTGQMNNPTGWNAAQTQGADWLQKIASGGEMQNNPYLEQMIGKGSQDIANSSNLMASLNGRYGSGGHQNVTEENIGDFAGNLRFQDYTNQQARRDAAIRDFLGAGTTGYNQRAGAAGNVAELGTTGFNQRADAIGSLWNAGDTRRTNTVNAPGQLANAFNAQMLPWQAMTQAGGALEGKNSEILKENANIFGAQQQAMRNPVEWLQRMAQPYNTGSQTTYNTTNPTANAIGGAVTGYDVFGGPYGAAAGALMGYLGGK
jgi:hypothetical protein